MLNKHQSIFTLDEILLLVEPNDSILTILKSKGKKYTIVGLLPLPNDGGEKLRKNGAVITDLFFLEAPKTYQDLSRLKDKYSLDIKLKYEEIEEKSPSGFEEP